MTRIVYLMERVSGREFESVINGKREIKIGIAKDADDRERQVDKGIPGKVILIFERRIKSASQLEAALHQLYKEHNFKVKGGKRGSGQTEFHRLSNGDVREVKRIIARRSRPDIPVFFKIIFFGFILYIILSILKT